MAHPVPTRPPRLGLAVRTVILLSLVLLPLGLISIWQNQKVVAALNSSTRATLMGQTQAAAAGDRVLMVKTLGAAKALGNLSNQNVVTLEECRSQLSEFVSAEKVYVFAAHVPPSGRIVCHSSDRGLPRAIETVSRADPSRTQIEVLSDFPTPGETAVAVTTPVQADQTERGSLMLAFRRSSIGEPPKPAQERAPLSLVTFNTSGEVISAHGDWPDGRPSGLSLATLAAGTEQAFTSPNAAGETRDFAVIELVDDAYFALSSWEPSATAASWRTSAGLVWYFPVAMWVASVFVGYFAVHQLVLQHINALERNLAEFARNRRLPRLDPDASAPHELARIDDEFLKMAQAIVWDEAELEGSLREKETLLAEKTVLLKEVHHRVKNNLQLISSIMNMQIRIASSEEAKTLLRSLQERILGLATVHRNLYATENLSEIDAGKLVGEMVEQLIVVGAKGELETSIDLDPVSLYPDQAVPLSLLAAEAVTNALKYVRPAMPDTAPWLSVSLGLAGPKTARLEIRNSVAQDPEPPAADGEVSTGLGSQLIGAFAAQLGTSAEVSETTGQYAITVEFKLEEFVPE